MRLLLAVVVLGGVAGCAGNAQVETGPIYPPIQAAPPNNDVLPSGVLLTARLNQAIATDRSHVGDAISATVLEAVIAENGETVVPAGARILGSITGLDDSDHPFDRALIRLDFNRLEFWRRSYPLAVKLESAQVRVGDRTVDARQGALAGAAVGAVAGAILSGVELDEILKGAAIGAGAGAVIGVITGGDKQAELRAGSTVVLRTTQSIDLR